nr:MAG TPA: hypothetical protein [Caudoviricetes sp.]
MRKGIYCEPRKQRIIIDISNLNHIYTKKSWSKPPYQGGFSLA